MRTRTAFAFSWVHLKLELTGELQLRNNFEDDKDPTVLLKTRKKLTETFLNLIKPAKGSSMGSLETDG
ncbi:hypothetical protein L596_012900 [Steinernema carpocapsae]|uniref:Uncharacterized protein n=1 Tax=Steinernema carpocapsae TaxID=34508 RepID=A0A4U5NYM4_STECR|nr:hypothetical protein L596_012900 [Steinernema carpocapsae]